MVFETLCILACLPAIPSGTTLSLSPSASARPPSRSSHLPLGRRTRRRFRREHPVSPILPSVTSFYPFRVRLKRVSPGKPLQRPSPRSESSVVHSLRSVKQTCASKRSHAHFVIKQPLSPTIWATRKPLSGGGGLRGPNKFARVQN